MLYFVIFLLKNLGWRVSNVLHGIFFRSKQENCSVTVPHVTVSLRVTSSSFLPKKTFLWEIV